METSDRALNALIRAAGDAVARRETFADETSTGRLGLARRSRRAIIAAAVEGSDYDWWLAFTRDYLPGAAEVKSADVLHLIGANPVARTRLLQGLADARTTIVIIDFSEFTASLVRTVYEAVGMRLDADPLDILDRGRLGTEVTQAIIGYARRTGLEASTVSRIEWLFHEAMMAAPVIIDEPDVLVDRDAYDRLDPKAKEVFLAHFSVAFAEALDPRRQAKRIANLLSDRRYFSMGNFAYERLEDALNPDRTFDQGPSHAIALLITAHEKMVTTLDEAMYNQLKRRAGAIREEDSRNVRGIQVADVAAGFAAREYEAAPGEVPEKAAHIRTMFEGVLLNDKWV